MTVDLEARRAELLVLRDRIERAAHDVVEGDESAGELSSAAGDQHLADHAAELVDREVDSSLEENAEQIANEIEVALGRIDEGTYGTCARCGKDIPEERLEAVPYAILCVDCKRLEERG